MRVRSEAAVHASDGRLAAWQVIFARGTGNPWRWARRLVLVVLLEATLAAGATSGDDFFRRGSEAYNAGNFEQAANLFRAAVHEAPSAGTLHNLGNAEWQCGRTGPAILAWDRAQWLDPFSSNTRTNLLFARRARQLDPPELAWYEICSTWLPAGAWSWLAAISFWTALAMVMLPGALRWRRAGWHQALAAGGFAVFLLTIPALTGIHTRSKMGVILAPETGLRLTPTSQSQVLAKLPAGEMGRLRRERGDYFFVSLGAGSGWVGRAEFELISARR